MSNRNGIPLPLIAGLVVFSVLFLLLRPAGIFIDDQEEYQQQQQPLQQSEEELGSVNRLATFAFEDELHETVLRSEETLESVISSASKIFNATDLVVHYITFGANQELRPIRSTHMFWDVTDKMAKKRGVIRLYFKGTRLSPKKVKEKLKDGSSSSSSGSSVYDTWLENYIPFEFQCFIAGILMYIVKILLQISFFDLDLLFFASFALFAGTASLIGAMSITAFSEHWLLTSLGGTLGWFTVVWFLKAEYCIKQPDPIKLFQQQMLEREKLLEKEKEKTN